MRPFIKTSTSFAIIGGLAISILVLPCVAASTSAWSATTHEEISCRKCHLSNRPVQDDAINDHCLRCHAPARRLTSRHPSPDDTSPVFTRSVFHQGAEPNCVRCHLFHEPAVVVTAVGDVDLRAAAELNSGHCAGCHQALPTPPDANSLPLSERLDQAHLQAAALYHGESRELIGSSPSTGCLYCHSQSSSSEWRHAISVRTQTFDAHASHVVGVRVIPGSGPIGNQMRRRIDPRIPLFEGRMECQSCHSLTAGTKNHLLAFERPMDMCLGCHQLKPDDDSDYVAPMDLQVEVVD